MKMNFKYSLKTTNLDDLKEKSLKNKFPFPRVKLVKIVTKFGRGCDKFILPHKVIPPTQAHEMKWIIEASIAQTVKRKQTVKSFFVVFRSVKREVLILVTFMLLQFYAICY